MDRDHPRPMNQEQACPERDEVIPVKKMIARAGAYLDDVASTTT